MTRTALPVASILARHPRLSVAVGAVGVVQSLLPALYVVASQRLVLALTTGGSAWGVVTGLGALTAAQRMVRSLYLLLLRRLAEHTEAEMTVDLMEAVARAPYERFDDGLWCDELATATTTVAGRLTGAVVASLQLLTALLANVGILAALGAVDGRLALAAVVSAVAVLPGLHYENSRYTACSSGCPGATASAAI